MAAGEITGADPDELLSMQGKHYNTPLYDDHGVPFEVAYCLNKIGKQPPEYDGPTRFCRRRVVKKDDYDGHPHDEAAYAAACPFHGGDKDTEGKPDKLEHPALAPLTHGMYAEDKHLHMDFSDAEQTLYDSIVQTWPEVYDWPAESKDPARYLILRKVATNVVRSHRAEDYLDDEGEVHFQSIFDDQGVEVGQEPQENPLSREYRLLVSEIINLLKELGLTPRERQKMDTLESEESANNAIMDIAGDALSGDDREYDPDKFEESDDG